MFVLHLFLVQMEGEEEEELWGSISCPLTSRLSKGDTAREACRGLVASNVCHSWQELKSSRGSTTTLGSLPP